MALYKSKLSRLRSTLYRRLIPDGIQERMDVMRHRSRVGESDVLFIHVPKAAGTAIANMLYGGSVLHITASAFRKYYPEDFERKFTFSVMRSPYSRTLSSYHFVKQGGTGDVRVDFKKEYLSKAFDSFETFLSDWLVDENHQQLDHTFRPQSEFICADGDIIVDYLGVMENLGPTVEKLNERTGKNYELPQVKNKMKPKSGKEELTPEAKAMIDEIYRDDVRIYRDLLEKMEGAPAV